jgi:xanthine dehydrogenase accessory factor
MVSYLSGSQANQVRWIPEQLIGESKEFPLTQELTDCLKSETPRTVVGEDGAEAYIEPLAQIPRLLIIGGGHVGQAIAFQARLVGFEITVYDDREEFAQPELFPPDTAVAHGDIAELVSGYPKGSNCYIVIVSKGHIMDAVALGACIHDDVRFLGLIGSQRKVHSLRKYFLDEGKATQAEWDRILSPIGYEIGAESVAEIGFSIVPQLIAARRLPSAVRNVTTMSLSS